MIAVKKLLSISIFVSLIYFFSKYRFKKKLELEKLRNRIAQDLHDEIGSTLSSLGIYSAALSKTIHSKPDNAKIILDKITTSATNMMEAMSDIVWSVNPSNDSVTILVSRMRSFAAAVTEVLMKICTLKLTWGIVKKWFPPLQCVSQCSVIFPPIVIRLVLKKVFMWYRTGFTVQFLKVFLFKSIVIFKIVFP